jgi:chromosome segregation ATPase
MGDVDFPDNYEDLLEFALDLQRQLDEKDEEIADLTKGQIGRGRRRGGGGGGASAEDVAFLETELRDMREKGEVDQKTINKLREDLATANIKVQSLSEEKSETDRKINNLNKRVEDLNKENRELIRKAQQVEDQSKEVNKQKSMNIKMSQQLSDENEALKDDVS